MISDISSVQNTWRISQLQSVQKNAYSTGASKTGGSVSGDIEDEAIISKEGIELYNRDKSEQANKAGKTEGKANSESTGEKELTPEEQRQVEDMKKRDQEVKTHEQAHMSAGSGLVTGSASYQYEKGPDGEKYAVSGEVHLDVAKEQDADATIKKAEQIKKAALAPMDPSAQDLKVAQKADQMIQEAQAEKLSEKTGKKVDSSFSVKML